MLLLIRGVEEELMARPDANHASNLYRTIDRHTLGQLVGSLKNKTQSLSTLENLLSNALQERNRLFHSFYRYHNFGRNSEEGRMLMLKDLESIHETLLHAYKAVMLLSGVDLGAMAGEETSPTHHVPI